MQNLTLYSVVINNNNNYNNSMVINIRPNDNKIIQVSMFYL